MLQEDFIIALKELAARFAESHISWALVASANCALQGLELSPGDVDAVIAPADLPRAEKALIPYIAEGIHTARSKSSATYLDMKARVNGAMVDIFSGGARAPYVRRLAEARHIFVVVDDVRIPCFSLPMEAEAYDEIGRPEKAKLVRDLMAAHPDRFRTAPGEVDYTLASRAPVINCVVEHEGKILLVRRSEKLRLYPGVWNGVSGFLDDGKNPVEKAKEELREEVGISPEQIISMREGGTVEVKDDVYHKTWVTHPIYVKVSTNAVKLNWEAEEYRWVSPEEAKKILYARICNACTWAIFQGVVHPSHTCVCEGFMNFSSSVRNAC